MNIKLLPILAVLQAVPFTVLADEADDWFNQSSASFESDEAVAASLDDNTVALSPEECAAYTYTNTVNPDAPFKKGKGGIYSVGTVPEARAITPKTCSSAAMERYANAANLYNETFGGRVRVYCMPIPLSSAFYTPDEITIGGNQHSYIRKAFSFLDEGVTGVDIYPILGMHAEEPIYSRTDHHWAPLGAYYAAAQFASQAGVPFLTLDQYEAVEIPDYVGTMYKFSGLTDIKNSPETFVYYKPTGVDYNTTYITYKLDSGRHRVVSASEPWDGKFFLPFKGSSTYCTFMGGDEKLTKVVTSTKNGRKVLILKDSFGNAIPGYLFGSFEEVHVADCRYCTQNLKDYVEEQGITDILFANNLDHASTEKTTNMYKHYLEQ